MPVSRDAAKKLRAVVAHLQAVPERADMNIIIQRGKPGQKYIELYDDTIPREIPRCGAVGCLAGWSLELFGDDKALDPITNQLKIAGDLLGLTSDERDRLFTEPRFAKDFFHKGIPCWPLLLAIRYMDAETLVEQVNVIHERVELFISSNGEE